MLESEVRFQGLQSQWESVWSGWTRSPHHLPCLCVADTNTPHHRHRDDPEAKIIIIVLQPLSPPSPCPRPLERRPMDLWWEFCLFNEGEEEDYALVSEENHITGQSLKYVECNLVGLKLSWMCSIHIAVLSWHAVYLVQWPQWCREILKDKFWFLPCFCWWWNTMVKITSLTNASVPRSFSCCSSTLPPTEWLHRWIG